MATEHREVHRVQDGSEPWGMFDHIKRYPWVLPVRTYKRPSSLIEGLDNLSAAVEAKVRQIRGESTQDAPERFF